MSWDLGVTDLEKADDGGPVSTPTRKQGTKSVPPPIIRDVLDGGEKLMWNPSGYWGDEQWFNQMGIRDHMTVDSSMPGDPNGSVAA